MIYFYRYIYILSTMIYYDIKHHYMQNLKIEATASIESIWPMEKKISTHNLNNNSH